jgi:formylglycine-generating enzyme required for sulfatase activity
VEKLGLRVFLSYHTPDRAVALALKNAIEAALPSADVYVDQTHLRHGHLWQPALFEAIATAQAFLILVSNQIGDWQKREYYEANDRKSKDAAFILLPVIIADRAKGPAGNLPGLAQLHWIESTEPTAPDLLAKIVAALEAREIPKPPEPWRAINPYRGLLALEEQDADFFFGRERETADILDRITAAPGRLIALVGNSGVGKSSLVQAGATGSLKRQRWPGGQKTWPPSLKDSRAWAYLAMKPGEDPIDALMSEFAALWFSDPTDPKRVDRRREWTERLRHGNARLADVIKASDEHLRSVLSLTPPPRYLLYIDQGEELYARTPTAERKRFSEIIADGLVSSAQRLIVMTSQRADYYGELQANAALFKLSEKIDVAPLDANALALVLREPARVLGVGFERDDLVRHVVSAAEDEPGALPLLADLFTDLWERMRERGDGTLRVSDRREIIQVGAALAKRADDFVAKNPDKVEAVKRLFTLRLAHVPHQGEPVRARWERDGKPRTDPAADTEWTLAELLAGPDWRLIVTGEKDGKATAEVAHEILLKNWPTLRGWLDAEREFLIWRGELDARRKEYDQAGTRDEKTGKADLREQRQALLMGLPLDTAKKYLAARRGDIEPADLAFIEASERAERATARTRQRLQAAVGVMMLGVIVVLIGVIKQDYLRQQRDWYLYALLEKWRDFDPHVLSAERERELAAGAEQAVKRGEPLTFRECAKDCPEMIVVPAGKFMMGRPPWEKGYTRETDSQRHQHEVTIARSFAVAKFDVTFTDWDACVAVGGCRGDERAGDAGWGRGTRPVINVNWDDAQAYVAWLSRMTGKTYRLLTEAEWEYAARAGTTTAYFWDDEIGKNNANCAGCGSEWDNRRTAPVGSFKLNAFGLYDMAGNVWQWVEDCYHENYDSAPTNGSAWIEGGDCKNRVVRGGSWGYSPVGLRSANRHGDSIGDRNDSLGFRVARTLLTP